MASISSSRPRTSQAVKRTLSALTGGGGAAGTYESLLRNGVFFVGEGVLGGFDGVTGTVLTTVSGLAKTGMCDGVFGGFTRPSSPSYNTMAPEFSTLLFFFGLAVGNAFLESARLTGLTDWRSACSLSESSLLIVSLLNAEVSETSRLEPVLADMMEVERVVEEKLLVVESVLADLLVVVHVVELDGRILLNLNSENGLLVKATLGGFISGDVVPFLFPEPPSSSSSYSSIELGARPRDNEDVGRDVVVD